MDIRKTMFTIRARRSKRNRRESGWRPISPAGKQGQTM